MKTDPRKRLLTIDALVNAVLGFALLILPGPTIAVLGLPEPGSHFYVTVLGAVLTGIAVALWIARDGSGAGLGVPGAIAINLLGAGTVLAWLVFSPPDMPLRGYVTLWVVVLVVLGIGMAELLALRRHRG